MLTLPYMIQLQGSWFAGDAVAAVVVAAAADGSCLIDRFGTNG